MEQHSEREGDVMAGKKALHMVHGEWMTIDDAAARLGVSASTLYNWRWLNRTPEGRPGLLVDAWDFYDARRRGLNPRIHKGWPPRKYRFRGKRRTVTEITREMGFCRKAIYNRASRRGTDLQTAIDEMEALQTKRATKELMKILGGT